jgi:hypothetical protein
MPETLTSTPSASADRIRAARRHRTQIVATIIAAVVLLLLAIGGEIINRVGSDLPPLAQLLRDVRQIYGAEGSQATGWSIVTHDHFATAHLAKLAVVVLNRQIDARILAYAGLLLEVTAIAALLVLLRRLVRPHILAAIALVAVLVPLASSTSGLRPRDAIATQGLLLLSIAQLGLMTRYPAGRAAWWCGAVLGLVNTIGGTAGIASSGTLVVLDAIDRTRSRKAHSGHSLSLVVNAALLGFGLSLAALRVHSGADALGVPQLASWPGSHSFTAVLIWFPALACVGTYVFANAARRHARLLPRLALWAVFATVMLAWTGADLASTLPIATTALVINATCLMSVAATSRAAATTRFVLSGIWAIVVGTALIDSPRANLENNQEFATAIVHATRDHSTAEMHALAVNAADQRAIDELLTNVRIRDILPASVRAPLALSPDAGRGNPTFRANAAPDLKERENLLVFGTWGEGVERPTGEFVSAPISTRFPFIQMRVGGVLRPPDTLLYLRIENASQSIAVQPLAARITALDRWRRINFVNPGAAFRVVAESRVANQWFGFAAPIEIGALTRIVAKIPPAWPTVPWFAGLTLVSVLSIFFAWRAYHGRRLSLIDWRVLPWLVLFGYAGYFSQHVDATAGPNDSGGYLNSAKLIASGHLTAGPRFIFGGGAGERDFTPYLPITFHAHEDRMVPEYPVGWPLEVAVFGKVFGLQRGLPVLIVAQLLLGVLLTQRIGKATGLPTAWAWLGAGIVAFSPVYLFEALQPVSDGPALVWVTAAVYWAWLSRDRVGYAWWAGAATALAVMIRPSNLLCVVPVLICLSGSWRRLLYWALAGLPGALFLAWYHQSLYGSWHTTGYGDISDGIGLRFAPLTVRSYAVWLPEFLTPLVFLGLAIPFLRSVPPRVRVLLASWVAVFMAFYAVYWCTWDSWFNMRFVLPAFPPMIVAALLVTRAIALRLKWPLFAPIPTPRVVIASTVFAAAALGFVIARTWSRDVTYWMGSNHKPQIAAEWVRDHAPANTVVFAKHLTGSLFYYTNLPFVRLDHPIAQEPELYRRIAATGRPIYALTCHWETRDYHWESGRNGSGYPDLPGAWERVAVLCEGEMMVWRRR